MNNDDKDKQISYILDKFDFDKVHKVMQFLDLRWRSAIPEFDNKVPSVSLLKSVAKNLLNLYWDFGEVFIRDFYSGGSGEFYITTSWNAGEQDISLSFILEKVGNWYA